MKYQGRYGALFSLQFTARVVKLFTQLQQSDSPMKFIPYSRLQSENLIVLLYVARFLAVIGAVLFVVALALFAAIPFLGAESATTIDMGNGMQMHPQFPVSRDYTALAIIGGVWSIVGSIVLLVVSGICAAVVSFEQTYTQKHTSPTAEGVTK